MNEPRHLSLDDLERLVCGCQLSGDPGQQAHLEDCPRCREALSAHRQREQLAARIREVYDEGTIAQTQEAHEVETSQTTALPQTPRRVFSEELQAGEEVGPYTITGPLGAGGMGYVYMAMHRTLRRPAALKVVAPDRRVDPETQARFLREARATALLEHPNIVTVYDVFQQGEAWYLAMQYVEGQTLSELIRCKGPLDPGKAASIARQVALGLEHARSHGVVHRDIKPANILVDSHGTAKILDLGLSRIEFEGEAGEVAQLTRDQKLMGTPDYLAPEQARDVHSADARSDIYSLGCTLYHMLTGDVPFPGGSLTEKLLWHQEKQPPHVQATSPHVPSGLAAVTRTMMAKSPADRFPTPADVADALAPWATSEAGADLTCREQQVERQIKDSEPQGSSSSPSSSRMDAASLLGRARRWRFVATLVGVVFLAGAAAVLLGWRGAHAPPRDHHPQEMPISKEPDIPDHFVNSIGMRLCYVPAGQFSMGATKDEPGWEADQSPPHVVKLTRGFFVSVHEVTEWQFACVMGRGSPAEADKQQDKPATRVSWLDAVEFCRRLSRLEGRHYRLPTEAEWEYACRAGSKGLYCFGSRADRLTEFAWFVDNADAQVHPVGRKQPNAWGLYDMHGNAWEWCGDWYEPTYYLNSQQIDPVGPASGQERTLRGGCFVNAAPHCRAAHRYHFRPDQHGPYFGMRIVCEADEQPRD